MSTATVTEYEPGTQVYDARQAYSTVDLVAYMIPPPELASEFGNRVSLGTLQMLSVSTHRDKFPVSACSRIAPRGFTSGHRTIAGTLSFTTFDREAFSQLANAARRVYNKLDYMHADEIPPFDIMILAVNDYGSAIYSTVESVSLLDSGVTYSLENIVMTENYSYMAVNRTPWQRFTNQETMGSAESYTQTIDWSDPRSNYSSAVYINPPVER